MIIERRNVFQLNDPRGYLLDHEVDSHHEVLDVLRAARERRGQRDEAHIVHPQCGRLQLWVSELGKKISKEHDVFRGVESSADFGFR